MLPVVLSYINIICFPKVLCTCLNHGGPKEKKNLCIWTHISFFLIFLFFFWKPVTGTGGNKRVIDFFFFHNYNSFFSHNCKFIAHNSDFFHIIVSLWEKFWIGRYKLAILTFYPRIVYDLISHNLSLHFTILTFSQNCKK